MSTTKDTTTGPTSPSPLSLTTHLHSLIPQDGAHTALFTSILPATLTAIASIATALRAAHHVAPTNTANTFGDAQLNVDVQAERILRDVFQAQCPALVTASSEEDPVEKPVHAAAADGKSRQGEQQYTVAFDPLDGSSIIAPNWTVGTILGIWAGPSALHQPAANQLAAVLGVYGPRTTAIVAVRVPGGHPAACFEVALPAAGDEDAEPEVIRTEVRLQASDATTRYFAPANLRAAGQDARYLALVNRYIAEGYTLRYSGGLVPDVVHALVKGHGVYVSPVTGASKAKLRSLYELFPIALVVECAGGLAVDAEDGRAVLDRVLGATDERAGLICGTAVEVEAVKKAFEI